MCFPWRNNTGGFRSCKRHSSCAALTESEGGDGGDGECYRHHARKQVFLGICVRQEELAYCENHSECPPDLRCVNKYCGENSYFEALHDKDCEKDKYCQVTESPPHRVFLRCQSFQDSLLGEKCCYDLRNDRIDSEGIKRRCCDGSLVIPPRDDLQEENISLVGLYYVILETGEEIKTS